MKCYGDSNGSVVARPFYPEPPISFLWNDPMNTSDSIVTNLIAGKYYRVLVSDALGNIGNDSILLINPDPIQIDSLIVKDVEICNGYNNGWITVSASGGTGILSFSLNEGDSHQDNHSYTFNNLYAGNHILSIKDINNCIFYYSVIIIKEPKKIQTGEIAGYKEVNEADITIYSVPQQSEFTYEWFVIGGNILSGQGTNFIQVHWGSEKSGIVSIVEQDKNGCLSDTTNMQVMITVLDLIEMNGDLQKYLVYPNPSNNYIIIESSTIESPNRIDLIDIYGKTINQYNTFTNFPIFISVGELPTGIYTLIIYNKNTIIRKKIIIK